VIKHLFTASILVVALSISIVSHAERPSITSLQQQINQLSARINDLEAQGSPLYVLDGNSNRIGRLVNWNTTSTALTNKKFLFKIVTDYTNPQNGTIPIINLYFEAAGCSGQAYVAALYVNDENVAQGMVINAYVTTAGDSALYYVKDAPATLINHMSQAGVGGCESTAGSQTVHPVTANDPSITGITQSVFTTPITIGD
jgi:hypothetical protein